MATILLIDDELKARAVLSRILSSDGHEVFHSSNGNEALAVLDGVTPDLVMTDILMPDKDGLEVIVELRRKVPGLRVIAFSGGGIVDSADYLSVALKLGAVRVFAKPFDSRALLAAVRELIGR